MNTEVQEPAAKYERTELGNLPSEWRVCAVGDAFEVCNQLRYPISQSLRAKISGPYPYYGPTSIQGWIDEFRLDGEYALIGEDGDHFLKWASQPMTLLVKGKFNVNNHAHVVKGTANQASWFYWFFAHRDLTSHLTRQGASRYKLTKASLLKLPCALPPLEEQRAIATALSDVDALIAGLERLIAKKRDIKQAAMQQLLTGQTRLPGFSGEWECRRLGDFVQFLKNGVNSRAELAQDGDVKYLHYGDIHGASGVFLDVAQTAMPCLPQAKAYALDRLRDGDLVFADASEDMDGIGKAVELRVAAGSEVVSGLHTIAARFDKQILADGFKAYLQFMPQFSRHLKRLAAGTKVFATHRGHVASAELNLPGVEEQTAIANVLFTMDIELSALEARLSKTRAIKQGMMQELLTGRTRLV
ncbi:MAG: restriction endonuclease subunit S [Hydrogenophaga sp.]|uniref:restriction endonuclease subunit S n=1 Tax=Hydrogenophaga sp. TaxID=1904254 RepID=UPI002756FCE3|nr:restriction endonuclease subunit S [Hydrogenophaga sp.]MDP2417461.1 restriction endonuclease subunit S [Hydrogenophaga sp.]MDZ4188870.1 restriction endonuclease subunit S [Hydrogenophaga sp.]